VIDRVSTLFRGHPSLIQGFNTFLPPGYRIECFVSAPNEEGASNTITVTTPMGVTTRTQDVTGVEAREFVRTQPRQQPPAAAVAAAAVQASTPTGTPSPGVAARIIVGSAAVPKGNGSALKDDITPVASSSALPPLPPLPSLPPLPPTLPTTVPKVSPIMYSPPAAIPPYSARSARFSAEANDAADAIVAQTPIMEFNHAINYVNKIKNRFTKDPETYKTFLEILQTYQKETRPIQEVSRGGCGLSAGTHDYS
jgi:paired amphipathic helix protein Sin3a